jgi:hypothetical protein
LPAPAAGNWAAIYSSLAPFYECGGGGWNAVFEECDGSCNATHHPLVCAEDELAHPFLTMERRRSHYRWLISQDNGCFSKPLTTPRLAQKTDLRTLPLLLEGGVRANMSWLDKVTGVFQRHPLPLPDLRRKQTCAPPLSYGKETCAI